MIPVASVCLSLHKQSSGDVVCVNFLLETDNLSLNFLMEFSKLLSCEWRVHGRVVRRKCEVFNVRKVHKGETEEVLQEKAYISNKLPMSQYMCDQRMITLMCLINLLHPEQTVPLEGESKRRPTGAAEPQGA